jgi:antitoxin (DNA-binding transcriptional repressor) of toxin-antitoxin stability system
MKKVAITDDMKSLAELIQEARESGSPITIHEHGIPVAELKPLAKSLESDAERLEELEKQGVIRLGSREPLPPDFFHRRPAVAESGFSAVAMVIEERRTGR